ncbi:MAG: Dna2/Cas4 domain-containing protein [Methanosarcinaceae archaeon]|nr:Dna2/Cas4 domain-containing protein [Methanosarcinaceae archaeon]
MFSQKNKINVNVSEILLYLRCPRQAYYTSRGHKLVFDTSSSYIEGMLLKELALAYPDVVNRCTSNNESILEQLQSEFIRAAEEFGMIYSAELTNVSPEIIENARSAVHEHLVEIGENLTSAMAENGKEKFLSSITPVRTEPVLHSDRPILTGIPGKLVCVDSALVPSIIKTGNYPENGVWKNDRLHLAALAMLVENEYKNAVEHGFVEYARYGIVRRVKIRPDDRRQVLKVRNRVEKIKDGTMPERKESQLCDKCNFSQMCSTKASLASKFF